jgi:hypothetical protein
VEAGLASCVVKGLASFIYPSPLLRRVLADYNSMSLLSHRIPYFIIPELS